MKKTNKYTVRFNYTSHVDITVEADNAEDALEKAKDELLDSKYDGEILNNVHRVDHDIMEG